MNPEKRLAKTLEEVGAELIRDKNHLVYKLPNGKRLTIPKTPGDRRAYLNSISEINRLMETDVGGKSITSAEIDAAKKLVGENPGITITEFKHMFKVDDGYSDNRAYSIIRKALIDGAVRQSKGKRLLATPEPATPEPATPEPATSEPATPEPATPEPATPEPATSELEPEPEPATPESPPTSQNMKWEIMRLVIECLDLVGNDISPKAINNIMEWLDKAEILKE